MSNWNKPKNFSYAVMDIKPTKLDRLKLKLLRLILPRHIVFEFDREAYHKRVNELSKVWDEKNERK